MAILRQKSLPWSCRSQRMGFLVWHWIFFPNINITNDGHWVGDLAACLLRIWLFALVVVVAAGVVVFRTGRFGRLCCVRSPFYPQWLWVASFLQNSNLMSFRAHWHYFIIYRAYLLYLLSIGKSFGRVKHSYLKCSLFLRNLLRPHHRHAQ